MASPHIILYMHMQASLNGSDHTPLTSGAELGRQKTELEAMQMKNEAIEVLMNRRAIRQYKSTQISDEELKTVLEAGIYAPTAANKQSPFVVAVQGEDRDTIARLNAQVAGRDSDTYYGAPTIIVVLGPNIKDFDCAHLDAAAVLTNMLNAAYAIGLGSVWVHRSEPVFDTEEGKALLRKWGLDENLKGICSMALGYPDCEHPAPKPRKENYYRIVR